MKTDKFILGKVSFLFAGLFLMISCSKDSDDANEIEKDLMLKKQVINEVTT